MHTQVSLKPTAVLKWFVTVRAMEKVRHSVTIDHNVTRWKLWRTADVTTWRCDDKICWVIVVVEEDVFAEGEGVDVVEDAAEVAVVDIAEPDTVAVIVMVVVVVAVWGVFKLMLSNNAVLKNIYKKCWKIYFTIPIFF